MRNFKNKTKTNGLSGFFSKFNPASSFFHIVGISVIIILLGIFFLLIKNSIPFFSQSNVWDFLTGTRWNPTSAQSPGYEIMPLVIITLFVTFGSMVISTDKALDEMNSKAYDNIVAFLSEPIDNADMGLNLYRVATSLERIGDLAKNISEEAIYYIRGEIVKHQLD